MALLDTHLHLIYRDKLGYSWTAGAPDLATGDFTYADARALGGDRIAGTIFMEVGVDDPDYQAEARLIAGMVGKDGLLGQIASCRPESDDGFDAWLDECDGLGVVGFRRILHVVDDGLSQTEGFRANVRKIGARGRVFDMCFLARQLPLAADLARACPDVHLVLDHCGVPDIAGGAYDSWAAHMTELAEIDNIAVKMSGILAYCAPGQATAEAVTPYLDHVLEAFGPLRMIWGSDWPVVNLGGGMPKWLDISESWLARLLPEEAAAIGRHNAERIYKVNAG